MNLLDIILQKVPIPCTCIIQNAHHLDDAAVQSQLLELMDLFWGNHRLSLTTNGLCGMLDETTAQRGLKMLTAMDRPQRSRGVRLHQLLKQGMMIANPRADQPDSTFLAASQESGP